MPHISANSFADKDGIFCMWAKVIQSNKTEIERYVPVDYFHPVPPDVEQRIMPRIIFRMNQNIHTYFPEDGITKALAPSVQRKAALEPTSLTDIFSSSKQLLNSVKFNKKNCCEVFITYPL